MVFTDVQHAMDLVRDELEGAVQNHAAMNSHHEAYGVLLEEVDEFWDEVKKKGSERNPFQTRAELIQVAAMAVRAIIDLGLLDAEAG